MNNFGKGYLIGAVVEIRSQFTNPDSLVDIDPPTVSCQITLPDGSSVTYSYGSSSQVERVEDLPKPGDVEYRFRYTAAVAGRHFYVVRSTGDSAAVKRGEFFVHS